MVLNQETLYDAVERMGHVTKGKVIVTETVSVLMVWYVAVITAGETFHQKKHYGDEYMIVAMVFI